jgi:hypothetical protein
VDVFGSIATSIASYVSGTNEVWVRLVGADGNIAAVLNYYCHLAIYT